MNLLRRYELFLFVVKYYEDGELIIFLSEVGELTRLIASSYRV